MQHVIKDIQISQRNKQDDAEYNTALYSSGYSSSSGNRLEVIEILGPYLEEDSDANSKDAIELSVRRVDGV